MIGYLLRRLASGAGLVVLLTFITFGVFFLTPTDRACLLVDCGPQNHTTPAQRVEARRQLGADRPFLVQYGDFLWHLVRHGEIRTFRAQGFSTPITTAFVDKAPTTGSLVLGGMVLLVLLALPLGVVSALRPHGLLDRGVLAFSLLGIALHPFVVGIVLRSLLSHRLHIAPSQGYCPLRGHAAPYTSNVFGQTVPTCGGPVQWLYHLYLPWLVFALFFLPIYTRMFRTRLLQTLGERFVQTARAKGASEWRVLHAHVFRNALVPILPMLAMDAGAAITAAIYVETIFNIQGLGTFAVAALSGSSGTYNLQAIMEVVFVVAVSVVALNLLADVALVLLDPRITGRSGSRRRTPRLVLADAWANRRRLAIASAVALALAGGGVALSRATRGGSGAQVQHFEAGARVLHTSWSERLLVANGVLAVRITRIAAGPHGWTVRATVVNHSPSTLALPARSNGTDLADTGFSLLSPAPSSGAAGLAALRATAFTPSLPGSLAPGESWTGTFGGADVPPPAKALYVGLGPLHGRAGGTVTVVTAHSFRRDASGTLANPPVVARNLRVDWHEHAPARGTPGTLDIQVTRVLTAGPVWQVTASITNRTHSALELTDPPPCRVIACQGVITDPGGAGFGLGWAAPRQPNGFPGGLRGVTHTFARPSLPAKLAPGASWHGTFGGYDLLPAHTAIWASFGIFTTQSTQHESFDSATNHTFSL